MSIIYVMIPLALLLVAVAVVAMIWAVRTGQFDELESHGWTPVLDDDARPRQSPNGSEPSSDVTEREDQPEQ
ncbi:MAG: cbb3-type cytochrome oxidase assembly protein CcoS [Pseudomonadota bacterium]